MIFFSGKKLLFNGSSGSGVAAQTPSPSQAVRYLIAHGQGCVIPVYPGLYLVPAPLTFSRLGFLYPLLRAVADIFQLILIFSDFSWSMQLLRQFPFLTIQSLFYCMPLFPSSDLHFPAKIRKLTQFFYFFVFLKWCLNWELLESSLNLLFIL